MAKRYSRGDVLSVKVQRVVDGDTVRVSRKGFWRFLLGGDPLVIRLYAMDAPESDQKGGRESTRALRRMLRGRGLMLEVRDYDRYDRLVGLLYHRKNGRERSVNLRMVEEGWAHAYTRYGGKDLGMEEAERRARSKRVGIWRRGKNEVPEDFRRRGRERASWRRKVKFRMAVAGGLLLVMVLYGLWVWNR